MPKTTGRVRLGINGIKAIAKNTFEHEHILVGDNSFAEGNLKALVEALKTNNTVKYIDIQSNIVQMIHDDFGLGAFADFLATNSSIEAVSIIGEFGEDGELGEDGDNLSIKDHDKANDHPFIKLAKALETNNSLKQLTFKTIWFPGLVLEEMAQALETNTALVNVIFDMCRYSDEKYNVIPFYNTNPIYTETSHEAIARIHKSCNRNRYEAESSSTSNILGVLSMTKPDNKLHNRYASSDFSYKGFVVKATLASDEQRRESYSSSSSQNEAMKHEQGSPVSTSMSCGSNS